MRLLLDTHALLWWWNDDAKLSDTARRAITDEQNGIFVSAASAWEIATKQRIGKLPTWAWPTGGFDDMVATEGFVSLPVQARHAWQAGALEWSHRDPFDRMLVAQAALEGMTLVSCDALFADQAVAVLW
ncbi:type II toxin-antitoxin system VapC family toxin [Rubrivivax albus]|uniref:Type II toxin-antitoxin system VapC family toxin n=1 Tax=Rubrivivax albus TaxID=2499835 RepID=A0A3S2TPH6_9BURK|nr:type II toxin-antitoxin system VapC family toxin [Rubrivivax albus]RVT53678.1 type II toxin-antitoxin system VapC family toxin [Rubrivivax albus]